MSEPTTDLERRLLLLAPTARDASLARVVLRDADIAAHACASADELIAEVQRGVGAVLLAEEAIAAEMGGDALARFIGEQPAWSDLPILVLTRTGADSPTVGEALRNLANVTLLERPIRIAALVSAARAALRARDRQYQIRRQLRELQRATERLRAREDELRDADRRKDEFLATLGHELRNPLAPVRNALEILRMTAQGQQPLLDMMDRQVSQMVRLIDDLLEVSRITRGKIPLSKAPVAIADFVHSAIDTSRPLIDAGRHELVVDLPAQPLVVDADSFRMAQVFANLLNNAAKYMDDGGRIELSARVVAGSAVFSVRDRGVGIPPAMLGRVFDMFTQVDPDRSARGGLGIGLTLVRALVDAHGGTVEAFSEGLGRGSEFRVRLPLAADAAVAVVPPAAQPDSSPLRRRVLVVDDNCDAADSLARLLTLLGADIRVAYAGPDALRAVDEFHPDVVLLDLGLPGMSGYEVAQQIRADRRNADIALAALTGWGQQRDRERSREAGFEHHLIKPVELPALKTLLRSLHHPAPH